MVDEVSSRCATSFKRAANTWLYLLFIKNVHTCMAPVVARNTSFPKVQVQRLFLSKGTNS